MIIDGIVRKQNGRLTFPADVLARRLDELAESGARIMREAGYRVETAPADKGALAAAGSTRPAEENDHDDT